LALGAEAVDERQSGVGERQSRVGESSMDVAGRGGNGLLLRSDSKRIRRTGRRLHGLRVAVGR
jgi:hypothetical protein